MMMTADMFELVKSSEAATAGYSCSHARADAEEPKVNGAAALRSPSPSDDQHVQYHRFSFLVWFPE